MIMACCSRRTVCSNYISLKYHYSVIPKRKCCDLAFITDAALVADLNEFGRDYEVSDDEIVSLTFSLIPVSRSIRVTGLDLKVDKGMLRNYFNSIHKTAQMQRPVLVEDIKQIGGGAAVIKFRRTEGMTLVLDCCCMLWQIPRFRLQ